MRNPVSSSSSQVAACALLCAFACARSASGQNPADAPASNHTDRVIVVGQSPEAELPAVDASTATRLPARILDTDRSVSVVNRRTLEDRQIIDPQEAIQDVAGVVRSGSQIGYGENFLVRGFQQQDIFKDGFRDGINGNVSFARSSTGPTDIANIERVEVLKGPASVLYGQSEPGGLVNYVTRQPYFANDIRVEQEFGSFDFYRTELNANWNAVPSKLALRVDAAYQNTDAFTDFVHGERYFVAPSLLWQPRSDTTVTFRGEYSHDFTTSNPGLPYFNREVVPGVPYSRYLGEPGLTDLTTDAFRGLLCVEHRWTENIVTALFFHVRNSANDGADIFLASPVGPAYDPTTGNVGRDAAFEHAVDEDYTLRLNQLFTWALYHGRDPAPAPPAGKDAKAMALPRGGGFPTVKNQLLFSLEFEHEYQDRPETLAGQAPINVFAHRYLGYQPTALLPIPGFPAAFATDVDIGADAYSGLLLDRLSVGDTVFLSLGGRVQQFDATQKLLSAPAVQPVLGPNTIRDTSQLTFNPTAGLLVKPTRATSLYFNYAESTNSFQNLSARTVGGDTIDPERSREYEFGAKAEFLGGKLLATAAVFQITKTNVAAGDPANPLFSVNAGEQRSRGFECELNGEPLPGWRVSADYAYTNARITDAPGNLNVGRRFFGVPYNSGGFFTTYEFPRGPLKGFGAGGGVFFSDRVQATNGDTGTLAGWAQTDLVAFYRRGPFRVQFNVKNAADNHFYYATNIAASVQPAAPRTFLGSVSVQF